MCFYNKVATGENNTIWRRAIMTRLYNNDKISKSKLFYKCDFKPNKNEWLTKLNESRNKIVLVLEKLLTKIF